MVVPHFKTNFHEILNFKGLEPKIMIPNVQELIDQETAEGEKLKSRKPRRGMTWDDYYLASEVGNIFREIN